MDSDKVRLPMRRYVIVFSLIVSMWGLGHWNTDAAIKLMRITGVLWHCCDNGVECRITSKCDKYYKHLLC